MSTIKARLENCEALLRGEITLTEARKRRILLLKRTRCGRALLRSERAESALKERGEKR